MRNEKKKILIIVPTLSPGGSERFVSLLFNFLDRSAFDVRLVVLNSKNIFYKLDHTEGIFLLSHKDVRSSWWALWRVVRTERPTIIFSTVTSLNILLSFMRLVYPFFTLFIRESTILSIHFKLVKNSFLYKIPIKALYRFSDRVICQSKDMMDDLIKNYGLSGSKKLIVINNPIDVRQFKLREVRKNQVPRFITVARLDPAKGFDRILVALSKIKIDFEYLVIGHMGAQPERQKFEEQIARLGLTNKVKIEGLQPRPQDYLSTADVYLHGSYYEGFPNVVLEAGAVGLPVVSFNTPGISEIIEHGSNGLVVPDHDVWAYAKAIEEAVAYPFDPQVIRNLIISKFDVSFIMSRYHALFNSVNQL